MTLRLNLLAAFYIASIHLVTGVVAVLMMAKDGHAIFWTCPFEIFSFPLRMILTQLYAASIVGQSVFLIIIGLLIESCCWGILLSLIFFSKKADNNE